MLPVCRHISCYMSGPVCVPHKLFQYSVVITGNLTCNFNHNDISKRKYEYGEGRSERGARVETFLYIMLGGKHRGIGF